jgi:hypothetical protein
MSVPDFYIDEIQDYLEELCVKNKIVAHTKPIEGQTAARRSFARFESYEHISSIQSDASKNIVVVADYYGQRIGEADDKKLRMTIQLRFAVKKETGTGDETNAINEAIKVAEQIMFQFQNRIELDYEEGCNALEMLEPEKISWDKIEDQPWLDDYYGWDLNLPFKSYMPDHDPADWDEEE